MFRNPQSFNPPFHPAISLSLWPPQPIVHKGPYSAKAIAKRPELGTATPGPNSHPYAVCSGHQHLLLSPQFQPPPPPPPLLPPAPPKPPAPKPPAAFSPEPFLNRSPKPPKPPPVLLLLLPGKPPPAGLLLPGKPPFAGCCLLLPAPLGGCLPLPRDLCRS